MACQNMLDAPIASDPTSDHSLQDGHDAFKEGFPKYLESLLIDDETEINLILQPDSSPHIGILCNAILAFLIGHCLEKLGQKVFVRFILCDQAKGEEVVIHGIKYDRALSHTATLDKRFTEYQHILQSLAEKYKLDSQLCYETEFFKGPEMAKAILDVILDRKPGSHLMSSTGVLPVRVPCPHCGLCSVNNNYCTTADAIYFHCPIDGSDAYNLQGEAYRVQLNWRLRNLVIRKFYEGVYCNGVQICGSDYAGFLQEQLLSRFYREPAINVYTPLIIDRSGAKVSKSLYLNTDTYNYLKEAGMEYLLSYEIFRSEGRSLDILCEEVKRWIEEPSDLFRHYSLDYMHHLFTRVAKHKRVNELQKAREQHHQVCAGIGEAAPLQPSAAQSE